MKSCHHCRRELALTAKVERESSCPHCFSDLKCCLNCRFHDRSAHNQCREPQAEWCAEKSKANFCEFFVAARRKDDPSLILDADHRRAESEHINNHDRIAPRGGRGGAAHAPIQPILVIQL